MSANITNLVGNLEGSARHIFKRCANNQMQGMQLHAFFYKQRQTEIGKKSSRC